MMNYNDKVIKNIKEEINRLTNQLNELEEYKDEISEEEQISIRTQTIKELIEHKGILDKWIQGQHSTSTEAENIQKVIQ